MFSEAVSAVTATAFISAVLATLKAFTVVFKALASQTMTTYFLSILIDSHLLVPPLFSIIAVTTATFRTAYLPVRKALAVPSLTFGLRTFTSHQFSPKIPRAYLEEVVDSFVG